MKLLVTVLAALAVGVLACGPVRLPTETPGPPGCGKRDPSSSGPSTLSIAQQTTIRNQGMPLELVDNDKGGKTWVYVRNNGSVFGEQEKADEFIFDDRGLLVGTKTEIRKSVGK